MTETTCREAGRRGGEATLATHGLDHYRRLGASTPPRPRAFYRRIAKLGGDAVLAKHGHEHYVAMARKGGETLLAQRGTEYYREMGRRLQAQRRAAREAT